jgi:hypothetical protein
MAATILEADAGQKVHLLFLSPERINTDLTRSVFHIYG